jgi:hypothetical protein
MYKRIWALALVLAAGSPLAWGQVRLGSEFQVNVYTTNAQYLPAVTSDANGNFVVVWNSFGGQDGSVQGVFGRRFDTAGNPLGSEFQVNTYTTGVQNDQAVSSDANGNVIVVWDSPQDSGTGIFARRFDPAGNPLGSGEFRVNSYTTGLQQRPKAAIAGDGSFVVIWESNLQDGNSYGIFARRYDSTGLPTGPDFQVNTYTTGAQYRASVAADTAGNFIVVWSGQDAAPRGVIAQRYDASGARVGAEFVVNTYTTGSQYRPSVAMAPDGRFMVVWETFGQDGDNWGVAGRRFDASGVAQGADFLVNTYTTGGNRFPAVAADAGGSFVVTWTSPNEDGNALGVLGRRYDVAGSPDPPFLVNTYTTGDQSLSAVAAASNGDFVVAWYSPQDGDIYGIFAQRLSPDLIFRDDFESASLSAWSSSTTDGGDLSPSAFAAMNSSSVGLQAVVDDTAGIFVQDDSPHAENRYRARFYFDPNGFDPGEAQSHFRTRIFIGFEGSGLRVITLVLKRQTGAYTVEGRVRRDDGTRVDTGFFPITDAPHSLELDWRRSSAPGADDGSFELWIDGSSVATLSGIDNDTTPIEFVRMGAFSIKTGAAGTLYWDEFVSRRESYIGP